MLSKLLSNINAGKNASADEAVSGSDNNGEGKISSSEQVFKSLLQSLQNEGSSSAKQQLLALSENSSDQGKSAKGENIRQNILGGSFTVMGEKEAENLQQADQSILKELQQEFQNIKSELAGDGTDGSSESETKVKTEQVSKDTSEDNTDSASSDAMQADALEEGRKDSNSNSNKTNVPAADRTAEKVAVTSKGEIKEEKKAGSEQKTKELEQGSKPKGATKKQGVVNLGESSKEKTGSSSNNSETSENGADENVKGAKDGTQKGKENAPSTADGKKVTSSQEKIFSTDVSKETTRNGISENVKQTDESSQTRKGNVQSTVEGKRGTTSQKDMLNTDVSKEVAKNSSGKKIQDEKNIKNENREVQGTTLLKEGAENLARNTDKQNKLFEETQRFAGSKVKPDIQKQPSKGQALKDQNAKPGNSQIGLQLDGTQTAKTEVTEQQKKVMNSLFQKNNVPNISAKGLEMKDVQNENRKKNVKDKAESGLRGFGKESAEGRNKLLSRLGISSTNAQKEAKPLNSQNFSGISVGDPNSSLKEQKINWEKQVTKAIDSSGEKESKARSGSGSMRLGQMPVANVSLRKKILPGLTQNIRQAASTAKENSGDWQKHSFTLDDGKNIQLSVRESKGVLQIKMGSMNLDLSKFLQQNLQQIREHLKQEFGSDIDLQFESQQQGDESGLSENTDRSNQKRNYRKNFVGESLAAEHEEEVRTKTVRNFGYNQMEWTA